MAEPFNEIDAILRGPTAIHETTRALKRIARAILQDHELAEDVVQSAWVESLEGRSKPRGRGWLHSLVRSRSIDTLRRRARDPVASHLEGEDPSAPQDELGTQLEIQRQVVEAVEALEEPYRTVLFLRYFQELGPQAISARQNVPLKTVKNQLTRGHALLRDRLSSKLRDADGRWSFGLLAFAGPSKANPTLPVMLSGLVMKKFLIAALLFLALFAGWHFSTRVARTTEPSPPLAELEKIETERPPVDLAPSPETAAAPIREAVPEVQSIPAVTGLTGFGSLAVTVLRADQTPAERVHVIVTSDPLNRRLRRSFRRRTNDEGVAHFAQLPTGTLRVESDRPLQPRRRECSIADGQLSELELTLEQGLTVTGRVLDPEDQPVPGATLWLTA
ncbi:MAG: sigma-70 family RNA polymerase sigma factor, partial [Planctomycetota bacterium]